MKALPLIFIFFTHCAITYAQFSSDSLAQKLTGTVQKVNIDSLQQNLPQLPDSLLPSFQRLDSIRNEFTLEADSIQQMYQHPVAEMESKTGTVNHTIDSLQKLDLPSGNDTRKAR